MFYGFYTRFARLQRARPGKPRDFCRLAARDFVAAGRDRASAPAPSGPPRFAAGATASPGRPAHRTNPESGPSRPSPQPCAPRGLRGRQFDLLLQDTEQVVDELLAVGREARLLPGVNS